MPTSLHLAVAQIHSRSCDVQGNVDRLERIVDAAAVLGVEAILFSETCLHSAYGLTPENLKLAEPVGGPGTARVLALARKRGMWILAGFLEKTPDGIYNSHLIAAPDGTWEVQRKCAITAVEKAANLLAGPPEWKPRLIKGVPCAVVICADGGHPQLHAEIRRQGIRYRLCPTAGGDVLGGVKTRMLRESELATPAGCAEAVRLRAMVFNPGYHIPDDSVPVPFASANALGDDGAGTVCMGHCTIVDENWFHRAQIPGTSVIEHMQDQFVSAVLNFA